MQKSYLDFLVENKQSPDVGRITDPIMAAKIGYPMDQTLQLPSFSSEPSPEVGRKISDDYGQQLGSAGSKFIDLLKWNQEQKKQPEAQEQDAMVAATPGEIPSGYGFMPDAAKNLALNKQSNEIKNKYLDIFSSLSTGKKLSAPLISLSDPSIGFKRRVAEAEKEQRKTMQELETKTKAYESGIEDVNKGYQENFDKFYQTQKELLENPPENAPIDQGRFWKNAGTGSKILMGIGLAFAAANPNSINGAVSIISDAIKNDINAQITDNASNMARWKMKSEGAQNLFGYISDKLKNDIAAKNLSYATGYKFAIDKIDQQMKGVDNAQKLASMEMMKNNLEIEKARYTLQAENAMRENEVKEAAVKVDILDKMITAQPTIPTENMTELTKKIYENVPKEYREKAIIDAVKIQLQILNE